MMRWLTLTLEAELAAMCNEHNVPLGVVVGWIDAESGGIASCTTSLCEYGLFQIMPSESLELGFNHERIHADVQYGIEAGFALIYRYRKQAQRIADSLGLPVDIHGSELLFRYTKWLHSIGLGAGKTVMLMAGQNAMSWDGFVEVCTVRRAEILHMTKHDPLKWVGLVNRVFEIGRPYGVGLPLPADPASVA